MQRTIWLVDLTQGLESFNYGGYMINSDFSASERTEVAHIMQKLDNIEQHLVNFNLKMQLFPDSMKNVNFFSLIDYLLERLAKEQVRKSENSDSLFPKISLEKKTEDNGSIDKKDVVLPKFIKSRPAYAAMPEKFRKGVQFLPTDEETKRLLSILDPVQLTILIYRLGLFGEDRRTPSRLCRELNILPNSLSRSFSTICERLLDRAKEFNIAYLDSFPISILISMSCNKTERRKART